MEEVHFAMDPLLEMASRGQQVVCHIYWGDDSFGIGRWKWKLPNSLRSWGSISCHPWRAERGGQIIPSLGTNNTQ
jgi:hypothetical protein